MTTKEQTILQTFADYFCAGQFEQIPPEVVHKSKLLMIDLVGVAIAGLKMDFPKMMIEYLADLQGKPEATLFGSTAKVPALHAALGNGVSGHALDMDDGYRFGGVHAGVAVIPAALAYAEANKASGQSLLLSVIMGYEIVNRISKAMNPSHLKSRLSYDRYVGCIGCCGCLRCAWRFEQRADGQCDVDRGTARRWIATDFDGRCDGQTLASG
jgi:2-methylcitrate dehydratase PrpD